MRSEPRLQQTMVIETPAAAQIFAENGRGCSPARRGPGIHWLAMKPLLRLCAALLAVTALAAPASDLHIGDDARRAAATMNADRMLGVIKELSSDAYQGRAPGTIGE